MSIRSNLVATLRSRIQTLYRVAERNVMELLYYSSLELSDTFARALEEYLETSYPLPTASGWVLDAHWGPKYNVPRNGLNDAEYRLYIQAQALLILSGGRPDEILTILRLLLPPAAVLTYVPYYPKAWAVYITGIPIADSALVLQFLETQPSPIGGGFATAGENGFAISLDPEALNYSSIHGPVTVTGFYGSINGPGGGVQAGHAHYAGL